MQRRSSGHDLRLHSLQVRSQSVGDILHVLHAQVDQLSIPLRSLELDSQLRHSILIVVLHPSVLILFLEDDLVLLADLSLCEESDVEDHSVIDTFINIGIPMLSGRML